MAKRKKIKRVKTTRKKKVGRRIYCYQLDKTFISSVEAAKQTGADQSQIIKVCRGEAKTAHKMWWCYAEDRKTKKWR